MLRGDFETVGLPDIIQIIVQNKSTGLLTVVKEDDEKSIYFRKGKIVSTLSNQSEHLFGNVLIDKKIITEDILNKALQYQHETGLKLGEILKLMKSIDEEKLQQILILQIEEVFISLFQWIKAEFSFVELEIEDIGNEIEVDAQKLILETARRIDEWTEIKKSFSDFDQKVRILQKSKIKVLPQEIEILKNTQKHKKLSDLCKYSHLTEIDTLKILLNLKKRGVLEFEK
mgnify:CR=1 FL=1